MHGDASVEVDQLVLVYIGSITLRSLGKERGDVVNGIMKAIHHGVDLSAQAR
ncbi:unannotated protein [freshwater metagenome]|uniref:Unannotated protein n=1 Tax=freshwater metagenome TaxID=449393 RepID=A0A6J7AK93_9ZZZZ